MGLFSSASSTASLQLLSVYSLAIVVQAVSELFMYVYCIPTLIVYDDLLKQASKLNSLLGSGSITALPLVETQLGENYSNRSFVTDVVLE